MKKLILATYFLVLVITGFSLTEIISREQADSCMQDAVAIYPVKDMNLVAEPHVANVVYIAPETALANGFVIPEETILVAFFDLLDIEYFQFLELEAFYFFLSPGEAKGEIIDSLKKYERKDGVYPCSCINARGRELEPNYFLAGWEQKPLEPFYILCSFIDTTKEYMYTPSIKCKGTEIETPILVPEDSHVE